MPNLCFTFVVNISLSTSNSCYFWGNWVSLFAGNSYYFLGNWVSLDQICALLFFFFGYYPKVIVITLQATGHKGQNRTYTFGFHGPIYNFFFWREGSKIAYFGANWKFSLCTHILDFFFFSKFGPPIHRPPPPAQG